MDDEEMSIEELIEKIQETKDPGLVKKFCLLMGFWLHEKDALHIALALVLNLITGLIVASFLKFTINMDPNHPMIHLEVGLILLTIFEFLCKKIIISKLPLVMLYSAGQVFTLCTFIGFGLMWIAIPGFGFTNFGFYILFVFVFCLLRMFISVFIRKLLAHIIISE